MNYQSMNPTEITAEIERRHPSKVACARFVGMLVKAADALDDFSRWNREHKLACGELEIQFSQMCELFAAAPPDVEEKIFDMFLKSVMAALAIGQHTAPEGHTGRDANSDLASWKFTQCVMALQIYLPAHPELAMKNGFPISKKFASRIRRDIQDALGYPVSITLIVDALSAFRGQTLAR